MRDLTMVVVRLMLAPLLHHDEPSRFRPLRLARPAPRPWRLTPARCVRTGFPQTQHTLPFSVSARIAQTAAVGQTSGAERPAVPWGLPALVVHATSVRGAVLLAQSCTMPSI